MISVDSLKLGIPVEAFNWIDLEKHNIDHDTKKRNNWTIKDQYTATHLDHGFNAFMLNAMNNSVTLNTSAKILHDNYRQGISLNTVEQYVDAINATGICSIDVDQLLKHSDVYMVDPCVTIDVSDLAESTHAVLTYTSANSNYLVTDWYPSGYVARKRVKSYIERQIGYSKFTEITAKKSTFAKDCPKAVKCFNENSLRIENNLTAKDRMRRTLGITNTSLGSVLNSNRMPVLDTFERIIERGRQIELFTDKYRGLSLPEIRNARGWSGIFQDLDNDLDNVIAWIRNNWTHQSGKRSYYYKLARQEYARRNKANVLNTNTRIDEIVSLLKIAS